MSGLHLQLDAEALRPLISAVVAETLAAVENARALLTDKLAFSEPEAARLLSLHTHQLRDERLRGRIEASTGPGRKVLYTREQLLSYLTSRKWQSEQRKEK